MKTSFTRNPRSIESKFALPLLFLGLAAASSTCAGAVSASHGKLDIPTYPWSAVKHPYFRGTDKVNIYPYPMLDFLSREKTNRTYRSVILENEYLRITFLPELGGKIHEVIDKTTGKPMFYVNHVIKPGLIGQCGAWTSGGVEWNTGPQGHTVSCMQPTAVEILPPAKDGSRSVAIGETERIYGTKWTVVVTLRPDRAFIEEAIRIYNPTETIRPYYFWNCTAAPNTPGFRFIYPMTLGCDHAGEKFFQWPMDNGKDLSRGTSYQDASSIFAWHCDQDFFGSYNDDLDHGAVSYANHHQLPGKKAWTWGYGGFGKMHQMDLTETDGPYNEVQTGPLLTQAQVGELNPCETVEWREWWYPIHGMGGFTFANKEIAVNANRNERQVELALISTRSWKSAEVRVRDGERGARDITIKQSCRLSPLEPTKVILTLENALDPTAPLRVQILCQSETLAEFSLPLDLPKRTPPEKPHSPATATEFAEAGWQHFLFARFSEAEAQFKKALELDPKSARAKTGLAFLKLDSDPVQAAQSARAALEAEPGSGLAHYAAAIAADRSGNCSDALTEAWKSALDPATATAARALAAKILISSGKLSQAIDALSETGPWQSDSLCRNRLAFALLEKGSDARAVALARENLASDPLDTFARSILWLAKAETKSLTLKELLDDDHHALLSLLPQYSVLTGDQPGPISQLLRSFCPRPCDPILGYWSRQYAPSHESTGVPEYPANAPLPYDPETAKVLQQELKRNPKDGLATLYLGDALFHLGQFEEGRNLWRRAAELGTQPVAAYRSLGMAAKTLDNDLPAARQWLEKASLADPSDPIVARDLANVLFTLADRASSDSEKQDLRTAGRDHLKQAFAGGKSRSDFVALLARAQNQLGQYAETATMLDHVRVTVWEGAHEVHDLFQQAHLALGESYLQANRPTDALKEFNRALEYPENLATGKLENAREAHIQLQRGNALAALNRKEEAKAAYKAAADEPASKDSRIQKAREEAKAKLLAL